MALRARLAFKGCCTLWRPPVLEQRRWGGGAKQYKAPAVPKIRNKPVIKKAPQKVVEAASKMSAAELAEFVKKVPVDDVWLSRDYPTSRYSLQETLDMHRELAQPAMLDNMDGFVVVSLLLDMTTKKKSKFLSDFKQTVLLPYYFKDDVPRKVLAFCKSVSDQQAAMDAGAIFAGGSEMVRALEKGEILPGDFTHCVATGEMLVEVQEVRRFLRDNFPNEFDGNLGSRVGEMVTYFVKGKTYQTTKITESEGQVSLLLGRLNQPIEELVANYQKYLETICTKRPPTLGRFVKQAHVTCPPSNERFQLKDEELSPKTKVKAIEDEESDDEDVTPT